MVLRIGYELAVNGLTYGKAAKNNSTYNSIDRLHQMRSDSAASIEQAMERGKLMYVIRVTSSIFTETVLSGVKQQKYTPDEW